MCVTEVIILFVWALVLFHQVKIKKEGMLSLSEGTLPAFFFFFLRLHKHHNHLKGLEILLFTRSDQSCGHVHLFFILRQAD